MVRFWSFKALNSLEFKGGHTGGVILTQNGPKMVENGRLQLKIWVNLEENGQKWLKMTFNKIQTNKMVKIHEVGSIRFP
jgi:hypothetical protein